jgi:hypothetical protein
VRGNGALALASPADNGCLASRRPTRRGVAGQVFPWGSQWLPSGTRRQLLVHRLANNGDVAIICETVHQAVFLTSWIENG